MTRKLFKLSAIIVLTATVTAIVTDLGVRSIRKHLDGVKDALLEEDFILN